MNEREVLLCTLWDLGVVMTDEHPSASKRGNERGFFLKSHEENPHLPLSPFLLNLRTPDNPKPGPLTPQAVKLSAGAMQTVARQFAIAYDAVAGIPMAGDPLAEQFAVLSGKPLIKLGKTVGTDNKRRITGVISGEIIPGQQVLLLDDLITYADSKREAITSLESVGLRVRNIIVLVDREQGGVRELQKDCYIVHPVFQISKVLRYYCMSGLMSAQTLNKIEKYLLENR
jgi:orotate phosphoribosyltransferase